MPLGVAVGLASFARDCSSEDVVRESVRNRWGSKYERETTVPEAPGLQSKAYIDEQVQIAEEAYKDKDYFGAGEIMSSLREKSAYVPVEGDVISIKSHYKVLEQEHGKNYAKNYSLLLADRLMKRKPKFKRLRMSPTRSAKI